MKQLERIAMIAGIIVAGITMAYRYVLNDEQREAAREAASTISDAFREVTETVSPNRKQEREANDANRARTAAQWDALGY